MNRGSVFTHQSGAASDIERARLADALMRTARRDREALSDVYNLTSAKLFGICLTVCGDYQAAQDTLHEVYMLVWNRAETWEPARGSAIAWLATIARNRAIDWRRAQKKHQAIPIESALGVADPLPCSETVLLRDEQRCAVSHCLGLLDLHQRNAIAAAFFHGATYAELADHANVPLGTMKSWVRRGLAQMKEHLEPFR